MLMFNREYCLDQETLDFVDEYDDLHGREWSNRKEGVAAFAEEFAAKQLAKVRSIMRKGTVNRRHIKGWETAIMDFCDDFQKGE